MMLVATPYRDIQGPRVISEIRKRDVITPTPNVRPKLTGELLVKCGGERNWWPRRVTVRGGQLNIASVHGDDSLPSLRIPLRHLSLQAGPLSNSLALCRGQNIILTLQTTTEHFFDLWVKTIAIELIRQTPIDSVKYLDILTLAEVWKPKQHETTDWNFNCISKSSPITPDQIPQPKTIPQCEKPTKPVDEIDGSTNEEKTVETLLKKCQNSESYVPVREKLVLFESLCRLGRKVRSSEDVSYKIEVETKRARSMHDLSRFSSHIAVREICKYFENKKEESEAKTAARNKFIENDVRHSENVQRIPKVSVPVT